MKIVSNNIKNALKEPTTQRKGKILVNGNYYEVFNVEYYADAYNEGNVIGNAIASQLDFDLPYIEKFDSFKYFDGVWTGNEYEYVDFGTFTVFDEKDQDEFNKHITAFDNLIKFNKAFEDKKDYPKTLFQELQNICNQAGVELENTSIVNGNFIVENNQFVAGENLKTVLKNICGISGTYAVIKNDKIVLQLKNVTNEVINKSHHEPIEWKRKTYGINQVVLGLKDVGGEYVVKQDDEDIAINGVHKLVINDNYFAYTQEKRQQLINELFEQVKGFGYIPYELKGEWLNYMDIGDTITIDDNETMILRINGKSPKSLESQMEAPAIIDSSIDYVDNTNTLADKQRRTELWVDKNVGEIRSEITKIDTTVENITTTTQTSKGGNHLYLEDAMESNALEYIVEGKSEQDGTPTPDTPVEVKTVKGIRNLFKVRDDTFGTQLVTYTKLTDNSIRISATRDSETTWTGYVEVPINLEDIKPNTTYTFSKKHKIEGTTFNRAGAIRTRINGTYNTLYDRDNITFTTPENLQSLSLVFYIAYTDSTIGTGSIDFEDIMLVEGSIQHSFVPYGSWLKVKDTGKNLFDENITNKVISDSGVISNNASWSLSNYIQVEPNTDFTLSHNDTSTKQSLIISEYDENQTFIKRNVQGPLEKNTPYTITTSVTTKYVRLNYNNTFNNDNFQFEKGSTATEYEPYKETSTLIDMNKPNLFDKDNADILNGYFYDTSSSIISSTVSKCIYIPINGGNTYTVSKISGARFNVGTTTETPNIGTTLIDNAKHGNYTATNITLKTSSSANYLVVWFYASNADTLTEEEIRNSIKIYEGTEPYYELSSINDTKDILTIQNRQVTINKRIGKIVLNGSEAWFKSGGTTETMFVGSLELKNIISSKNYVGLSDYFTYRTGTFDIGEFYFFNAYADKTVKNMAFGVDITEIPDLATFKTWLSENPVTIYYILDEPQTIELGDFPIMLYNGINNVTLVSDLETTTQITYLRNTPLSNDYATNQRVDKTDSDLEQTNNSLNQTKQDVENTALDLHNNYYDKEQIDSIITTTEEEITTLKQTVETNTSSTNLQISVIEEQLKNGVTAVKTETGYTFDKNGLNISKTGSEMSSTLDNDGLSVKRDNTEVLTVRSAGVETENLKVRTYFTIGSHTRVEDYGNGTGFFHIGGV